ncbi:hypothetical protein FCV25MIE_33723 [Fagus crenata]
MSLIPTTTFNGKQSEGILPFFDLEPNSGSWRCDELRRIKYSAFATDLVAGESDVIAIPIWFASLVSLEIQELLIRPVGCPVPCCNSAKIRLSLS